MSFFAISKNENDMHIKTKNQIKLISIENIRFVLCFLKPVKSGIYIFIKCSGRKFNYGWVKLNMSFFDKGGE